MKYLVVTATSAEVAPLKELLGEGERIGLRLTRHRKGDHLIDILVTGVGMVATSYWIARTLKSYSYQVAVNAGICGSFSTSLQIGEVVHVVSDSFPELGAESADNFITLSDLKMLDPNEFPFVDGILKNTGPLYNEALAGLKAVKGVTVNTVHGNLESIRKLEERVQADVESMEGASFFFVSFLENTPCIQLRAVSNYVGPRDKSKWNIPLAIRNLNIVLANLL